MTLITLNNKSYNIPSQWNELTIKQLLEVMDTLFLKEYPAEQMLLKLLKVLTGMSTYQFLKCKVEEMEEFFYLFDFILQENIEFTKCILPVVENFHGPSDEMSNLKMSEFAYLEHFIVKWFDDKEDKEAVDELVAILYRPAKEKYDFDRNPDGDFRVKFNENLCSYNAKNEVAGWPVNLKLAIVYWYIGCRKKFVDNNPEVFNGGSGEPAKYGLVSVMLDVAEGGVFGNFESVEDQYVNLIMMQLNQTIDKANKMEKASAGSA